MHCTRHISPFPLLLALALPSLLTGCGGGGGGSSTPSGGGTTQANGEVSGKVVDTSGTPVATAAILLDGVPVSSGGTTFTQGGFQLPQASITPGVHTIGASTTVNGVTSTGATQVYVPSGASITNANIIVSPLSEQATLSGTVTSASTNQPIKYAEVILETTFASTAGPDGTSATTSPSTTAIAAYTDASGHYQFGGTVSGVTYPGFPTVQGAGNTLRTFTVSAAYPGSSGGQFFANSTPTSNQTFTAGSATTRNFTLAAGTLPTANAATPTVNFIEAFTEPDDTSVYTPGGALAVAATSSAAAAPLYRQVEQRLSPHYAALIGHARAAAQVKHLAARPNVGASPNQYTVEMSVFFSLPNDDPATGALDPVRNDLSGFEILTDALSTNNVNEPYDFLEDPLASYWDYEDITSGNVFIADTLYTFAVQSYAGDGSTALGTSASASAAPLSLVNLTGPVDPADQNNQVSSLSPTSNITWTMTDPNTAQTNLHVGSYYVFLYSTFPGVTTTPAYQSGPLSGTTNSWPLPSGLSTTTTYWAVVAAVGDSTVPTGSASISVSQIVPFTVQ